MTFRNLPRIPAFRAVDVLMLASLGLFTLLALVFHSRLESWEYRAALNLAAAGLYLAGLVLTESARRPWLFLVLRTACVLAGIVYLFYAGAGLQRIFVSDWQDAGVLTLEEAVFGIQPTIWLEQFVKPWLTEWMMFCYVGYLVIFPRLAAVVHYGHGRSHLEDFFFTLVLANMFCHIGFMLFPVAGPMPAIGHLYSVPLEGFVFTQIGEIIRNNFHPVGQTLPSPHSALGVVLWVTAWRYNLPAFYILVPIMPFLFISTFYGRYHYVSDTVAGILLGILCLYLAPRLRSRRAAGAPGRPGFRNEEQPPGIRRQSRKKLFFLDHRVNR